MKSSHNKKRDMNVRIVMLDSSIYRTERRADVYTDEKRKSRRFYST